MFIANQVLLQKYCTKDFFRRRFELQQKHLSELKELFGTEVITLPLLDSEIRVLDGIREAAKLLWE